jgi:antirestriction protein ArdC
MSEDVPSQRRDLYRSITDKIIAAVEAGTVGSKRPWHAPALLAPSNANTSAFYRGINVLTLWIEAMDRGYPTSQWASYRQWQELGAQVRKGERGALIVFYKRIEEESFEIDDHTENRLRFVARASYVFNEAQVDGFETALPELPDAVQPHQQAEAFIGAVGARIEHGFREARYRRDLDNIEMPLRSWFTGTGTQSPLESYYGVLLHELTHWTGAPHRLGRDMGKRFGDDAYAMEELVAELGAAFACSALGIVSEPRPDHAAYVSSWLNVLKRDPKAIFTAASKAQEAFEHLAYLATRTDAP